MISFGFTLWNAVMFFHTHSTLNTLYSCIDYWIKSNAILLLCVMFFSRINQKSHRLYSFVWLLRCFDLWFNTKWHQCSEWQTVVCVFFWISWVQRACFSLKMKVQKCKLKLRNASIHSLILWTVNYMYDLWIHYGITLPICQPMFMLVQWSDTNTNDGFELVATLIQELKM